MPSLVALGFSSLTLAVGVVALVEVVPHVVLAPFGGGGLALYVVQIFFRVEQAVNVIDAQARD
jgi:threonine dehydratase